MIKPTTMPTWYKIIQNANKENMQININIDPITGLQTGNIFFDGTGYMFKLKVEKCNMVMSLKKFNKDLIDKLAIVMEGQFRIVYKLVVDEKDSYIYHVEWYYDVEEDEILNELANVSTIPNIKVLYLK